MVQVYRCQLMEIWRSKIWRLSPLKSPKIIPPPPPLKHKSTQSPTLDHECGSGHCKSPACSKPFFDRPNILIVLSVMEITRKNTTETVIIMIKNFRENGINCKKLRFYLQEKNIRWSSSWQYCFQYWVSNANVCPYFLRLYCWSVRKMWY